VTAIPVTVVATEIQMDPVVDLTTPVVMTTAATELPRSMPGTSKRSHPRPISHCIQEILAFNNSLGVGFLQSTKNHPTACRINHRFQI